MALGNIHGLVDGSVLHLVLNDNLPPAPARGILVACSHNKARDRGSCGKPDEVKSSCGCKHRPEEGSGGLETDAQAALGTCRRIHEWPWARVARLAARQATEGCEHEVLTLMCSDKHTVEEVVIFPLSSSLHHPFSPTHSP